MAGRTLGRMPVLDMLTVNTALFLARALVFVHPTKTRELEPSSCARFQLGWPRFQGARRKPFGCTLIPLWTFDLQSQSGPVRGWYASSLWGSRVTKPHFKALKRYPHSRGAGGTHSARRHYSWLNTEVNISLWGDRRAWCHCPCYQCGAYRRPNYDFPPILDR